MYRSSGTACRALSTASDHPPQHDGAHVDVVCLCSSFCAYVFVVLVMHLIGHCSGGLQAGRFVSRLNPRFTAD
jgi:hypothetical protein